MEWPTFSQSFATDQLFVSPGASLWPDLPTDAFKQWPYGVYIGKDKSADLTVIVSIIRPASAGGGGYQYEGTISISAKDNDPIVVAAYCN